MDYHLFKLYLLNSHRAISIGLFHSLSILFLVLAKGCAKVADIADRKLPVFGKSDN